MMLPERQQSDEPVLEENVALLLCCAKTVVRLVIYESPAYKESFEQRHRQFGALEQKALFDVPEVLVFPNTLAVISGLFSLSRVRVACVLSGTRECAAGVPQHVYSL
ncbi:hypothetical protein [Burkholderia sp. SRS-W-2-2016]|uniref:hypothetical protein n=1 Tax=Burkholderia sp. SRS-W-2-2016 TaxID=1926878 RepID=UPI00117E0F88|nr:hypothetical protein [Burkholderia sp. SRS-W-2-2016]